MTSQNKFQSDFYTSEEMSKFKKPLASKHGTSAWEHVCEQMQRCSPSDLCLSKANQETCEEEEQSKGPPQLDPGLFRKGCSGSAIVLLAL